MASKTTTGLLCFTGGALAGAAIGDDLFREAGEAAAAEVSLLSDAHGSAPYKRELLRVYMRRILTTALA